MKRPPNSGPGRDRGGWRAFALGMVGMFVVIAVWIALFETTGERTIDEARGIERPLSEAAKSSREREAGPAISDYR